MSTPLKFYIWIPIAVNILFYRILYLSGKFYSSFYLCKCFKYICHPLWAQRLKICTLIVWASWRIEIIWNSLEFGVLNTYGYEMYLWVNLQWACFLQYRGFYELLFLNLGLCFQLSFWVILLGSKNSSKRM